jgi:hypothetical protein
MDRWFLPGDWFAAGGLIHSPQTTGAAPFCRSSPRGFPMTLFRFSLVLLATISWIGPAKAEEPAQPAATDSAEKKPAAEAAAAEKVPVLFDGKTLANWKIVDFAGGGDATVEDGAIVIGAGQPMSGIVWTGGELPKVNYELTFEARRVDGSDFFVGLTFQVKDAPCTLILGGWGGGLTGFSSIDGQDAAENETTSFMQVEKGRWYKVRLRVTEARIDAFVDDKRIGGFDYRDRKLSIRIEVERTKPLGFSTFQTVGAIKDLKLRELTAEEAAEAIKEANQIKKEKES